MADPRPRLEVVGSGDAPGGPEPGSEGVRRPPEARGGLLVWVLAGLLAVAVAGLASQGQRAADLEAEVAGLQADLDAAQKALTAHERHLDDVRASVAELQALVARDPLPGPSSER